MAAECKAPLLAELLAVIDGVALADLTPDCTDPVAYAVTVERESAEVALTVPVCAGHEQLVSLQAHGYRRSIKLRNRTAT